MRLHNLDKTFRRKKKKKRRDSDCSGASCTVGVQAVGCIVGAMGGPTKPPRPSDGRLRPSSAVLAGSLNLTESMHSWQKLPMKDEPRRFEVRAPARRRYVDR